MVDALRNLVKFFFQPVIRANIEFASEQGIKGTVEILLGCIGVTGLILRNPA